MPIADPTDPKDIYVDDLQRRLEAAKADLELVEGRIRVQGSPERGVAVAEQVRTGTIGVNQGYTMDPFAPFGGVKGSGYGRELGPEGLESYLDIKSIAVAS